MGCNTTIKNHVSMILMTEVITKNCKVIFLLMKNYIQNIRKIQNNNRGENKYHQLFHHLEITMIGRHTDSQLELCLSLVTFLKVGRAGFEWQSHVFRKACSHIAPLYTTSILKARPILCKYIHTDHIVHIFNISWLMCKVYIYVI